MMELISRDLLVGGRWVPADAGAVIDVHDPATGERIGRSALAGTTDVEAAAQFAVTAQKQWAAMHADERAAILRDAANLVDDRIDAISQALTLEQGKPLADSRKEIAFGAEVLRYYAEEGRRIRGSMRSSVRRDMRSLVGYSPVGVVAAIVPWNYPVDLYCWKVAPALAAGCAVIAKPPVETPLAIGLVAAALTEAGVPEGVLADLPGDAEVGAYLCAHPAVRMVTATASTATGQAIMRAAADGIKRLSLELGGHTPLIVLDDADLEEAAAGALRRSFSNMGQICISVNRVLVADAVADDFVEALADGVGKLELGHGLEPGVAYGPVLNETVRSRARIHTDDAVQRGGRLVVGGSPPSGAAYERGTFFLPTVIDDVPDSARVMTEETYGPVAAVHRCGTAAELLAVANSLPYGLAAYVYSEDLERAWAFADRVEAGSVGINVNDVTELQAPFGGWKLSGLGRELGPEGLQAYLETRHLRMRVRPLDL